jgi:hypothetical protein
VARSFVPRRPRPPLTTREIAAFLAGGRAAKAAGYADRTAPELEALAMEYANEDMPIAMSLDLDKYIFYFVWGYCVRTGLDTPK